MGYTRLNYIRNYKIAHIECVVESDHSQYELVARYRTATNKQKEYCIKYNMCIIKIVRLIIDDM